jgi:hypothetical protein
LYERTLAILEKQLGLRHEAYRNTLESYAHALRQANQSNEAAAVERTIQSLR